MPHLRARNRVNHAGQSRRIYGSRADTGQRSRVGAMVLVVYMINERMSYEYRITY